MEGIAAVEKRKGGPGGGERRAGPAEKVTGGSLKRNFLDFFYLYEPEAVRTFIAELKGNLKPGIEIREVDANIDDPATSRLRGLILGIPADAWGGVFPRRWV